MIGQNATTIANDSSELTKISSNIFQLKYNFSKTQIYTVIIHLEDDDWKRPSLLGCDNFRALTKQSKDSEIDLIKKLISCRDPESAFNHIKLFIQRFGNPGSNTRDEVNLLEEIRRIGFTRIIDTNDDFDWLILRIDSESFPFIHASIDSRKRHCIYSFESLIFNDSSQFPKLIEPLQKGFLSKVLKKSNQFAEELERLSNQLFVKLDENFNTLNPERFNKKIFSRKIHLDTSDIERELTVAYNFNTKNLVLVHAGKELVFNNYDTLAEELKGILSSISIPESRECGICYSDFLDGVLADFTCAKNSASGNGCNQVYHENCLLEWFRANPESRTIFDKICGKCLFCEKEIYLLNK